MSITQRQPETDGTEHRTDGGTDDDESLVVSLVTAIADQDGSEEMSPVPLYDHIDPEAVEQLLAHAETREESQWELTFTVEDATVTVTSDGEVDVR